MVTPIHALLPPNSTDLEMRLCAAFDRDTLSVLADVPRRLKTEPADVLLPWLASEWFLAGFVKYFPTLRDLIEAGLPWLMERGTAAAVKRALRWIDINVAKIEEDGSRLQLDTGRVIYAEELADVVYLILASIPAHVDLYRLYYGYDLRPIGLSMPAALDEGLLSDDSGIWVNIDGEDVKLSFGHKLSRWIDFTAGHFIYGARRDTCFDRVWYEDRARLSVWHLDSEIIPNRKIVIGQLITSGVSGTGGINAYPPTLGRHLNIARSALDLDEDADPFGDLNCGFAGGISIEYNPFVLSDSKLSDHDNDLRHIYIDERFSENRAAAPAPLDPTPVTLAARAVMASQHISRGTRENWTGVWDSRRWQADSIRIPTRLIHEETT
ncbi:MAG: phage tail protein [Betaproteobacteria bacterium]|nr:phage tail protein [Betaproteobacteria bacterium]